MAGAAFSGVDTCIPGNATRPLPNDQYMRKILQETRKTEKTALIEEAERTDKRERAIVVIGTGEYLTLLYIQVLSPDPLLLDIQIASGSYEQYDANLRDVLSIQKRAILCRES